MCVINSMWNRLKVRFALPSFNLKSYWYYETKKIQSTKLTQDDHVRLIIIQSIGVMFLVKRAGCETAQCRISVMRSKHNKRTLEY